MTNCVAIALNFAIPRFFWPYFAGFAVIVIGVAAAMRDNGKSNSAMERLFGCGPLFFAFGMAVFGADHFIAAKFVATIVPSWIPWHLFWAYFVGTALIAGALSLASNKLAGAAAMWLGIMIFLFVLTIHLPGFFKGRFENARVTLLFRDLALSCGAIAFASSRETGNRFTDGLIVAARIAVGATLLIFGVDHFLNPAVAPGIPQDNPALALAMPAWVPAHAAWAYATGSIFIVCGLALVIGKRARSAAITVALTTLVLILFAYLPLTVSKPTDIDDGLNYLAIHFALAGAALMLASALPKHVAQHANAAAVTEG